LLDIRQIRRMLANDGVPDGTEKRFFGPGDVLRNAELEFGDGANVHVESQLEGCAIKLSPDADFVLGERGLMLGCVVTGGRLVLHGRFTQGDRVGLVGPKRLVASSTAIVCSTIEQPETRTEFAFERGCRLRVKIKQPAAQEKNRYQREADPRRRGDRVHGHVEGQVQGGRARHDRRAARGALGQHHAHRRGDGQRQGQPG
jgi:hypothetical protein